MPLDFLRGLAALGIAVHHYLAVSGLGGIESLGRFGVYTFFILSALAMMIRYDRDFSGGIRADSLKTFYRNRFARVIPLLAVVAIINFMLGRKGWEEAFLTGSGLFALQLPILLSNTTGAWSLGIELMFYALFPLICLLARSSRVSHLVAALAIAIVGQQALFSVLAEMFSASTKRRAEIFHAPLMFAPFFLTGILIYALPKDRIRGGFPLGVGMFLAAVLSSLLIKAPVASTAPYFLALTVACGLSVAFLYRSEVPARLARPSYVLGEISYSLYLLHPFVLLLLKAEAFKALPRPVSFLAFMSVSIGVAYLSYRLFEKPVRDALRGRGAPPPFGAQTSPPI